MVKRALILLARAGAMAAASLPAADAVTVTCEGECAVQSHSFASLPPVLVVQSGTNVTWTSLDTSHVNTEYLPPGDPNRSESCFFQPFSPFAPSEPVKFEIRGKTLTHLVATSKDPVSGEVKTYRCEGAESLSDGSQVLTYYCVLHPQMRAAVVVTA